MINMLKNYFSSLLIAVSINNQNSDIESSARLQPIYLRTNQTSSGPWFLENGYPPEIVQYLVINYIVNYPVCIIIQYSGCYTTKTKAVQTREVPLILPKLKKYSLYRFRTAAKRAVHHEYHNTTAVVIFYAQNTSEYQ